METFDESERHIGFIFDATWEPELGIGVKVKNGDMLEVGNQVTPGKASSALEQKV